MKKAAVIIILLAACFLAAFRFDAGYPALYRQEMEQFRTEEKGLSALIKSRQFNTSEGIDTIKQAIHQQRIALKKIDFWLRYLEPIVQKHINGPLPVEWETEVFEKFEKPYRRTGGGLSLAEQYLGEPGFSKDSLEALIRMSVSAMDTYMADSITTLLNTPEHFYYANRLFLLNLAAIYTTGFDCPDTSRVIPELKLMLPAVRNIYTSFNTSFPSTKLSNAFLSQYDGMISFIGQQPDIFSKFDRYGFIRNYVNPLFSLNQELIRQYRLYSKNYNDFALNDHAVSIFDKSLYKAQTPKGIFSFVDDPAVLEDIRATGKLLFNDPILSGNNKRSCASCHKPSGYFADSTMVTPLAFEGKSRLERNAPSLVNASFNHLMMLDGKELSLQSQAKTVITSPRELNSNVADVVKKVMSCREYADAFKRFLPLTPEENEVGLDHIISAMTLYYSSFDEFTAPFDDVMNRKADASEQVRQGFNLFMSKAQCGTCHFTPLFNGVKPPYVGSEFEVLGVPADTTFSSLSADSGRFRANPAHETFRAFRTGSIRNSSFTPPYMHNGVFNTMDQVIDFYDKGGGAGRKLPVENQTLDTAALHLTADEKSNLIAFLKSLDENITFDKPPKSLPSSSVKSLNNRKVGGEY